MRKPILIIELIIYKTMISYCSRIGGLIESLQHCHDMLMKHVLSSTLSFSSIVKLHFIINITTSLHRL